MPIRHSPSPLSPSAFYLFDDIAARLCAAYQHLPAEVQTTDSLLDLADYLSRYSRCTSAEAMSRLEYLFAAGFVDRELGEVHPDVLSLLERLGGERVKELSYDSGDNEGGGKDDGDDDNEN